MDTSRHYPAPRGLPPGHWLRRLVRRLALVAAPDLRSVLDLVEEAIAAIIDEDDQHALERLHVARQVLRG